MGGGPKDGFGPFWGASDVGALRADAGGSPKGAGDAGRGWCEHRLVKHSRRSIVKPHRGMGRGDVGEFTL